MNDGHAQPSRWKLLALGLGLSEIVAAAASAGTVTGKLSVYQVDTNNLVISISAAETPPVSCNSSHAFIVPLNTPLGQNLLLTINTAERSALTVTAIGSGTCSIAPTGENLIGVDISS